MRSKVVVGMRVLVIGGSGLIGHYLLPRLVQAKHRVTVISRGNRALSETRVRHIQADRAEVFKNTSRLGDYDAVIDNIAYRPEHAEEVLEAFKGRLPHYLVISTAFIYPGITEAYHIPTGPFREQDVSTEVPMPPAEARDGHGWYVYHKQCLEWWLSSQGKAQGTSITVIRPLLQMVGPNTEDGRFAWFWLRVRDGGPVWLPNDARTKAGPCQLAFSGDVAQLIVKALEHPPDTYRAYNAGQPELWTYEEYIRMMADVLGTRADIRYASRESLDAFAGGVYCIPLPYPVAFDVSRAACALGVEATPMRQWIEETGSWMSNFYHERTPQWFLGRHAELGW